MRTLLALVLSGLVVASIAGCSSAAAPAGDCEELAAADVLANGASRFTDTGPTPVTLTLEETDLVGEDRATVLVSVDPRDAIGYDPLLYFSECRDGEAVLLGVYVPVGDEFELLFTTDEGSAAGDVPLTAPDALPLQR